MVLQRELNLFAINITFDVGEYFLQNCIGDSERNGPMNRCSLFSEFGQITIERYLKDKLAEFYTELKNNQSLQNIDDNDFEKAAADLIGKSDWHIRGHTTFYETCVKIIVLGIFAMQNGFTGEKTTDVILKISQEAYSLCFLDQIYDAIRSDAQSIIYTLLKILGLDINKYTTPVEKEIGWSEIQFPTGLLRYILQTLPGSLQAFRHNPNLKTMDSKKFDSLVKILLEEFAGGRMTMSTDYNDNFLLLAISIGFVSYYSIQVSFNDGLQKGLENIIKLVILEKRYHFISRVTRDRYEILK